MAPSMSSCHVSMSSCMSACQHVSMCMSLIPLLVSDGHTIFLNNYCGYLLRTKLTGVDEGGVASGYAVLDSPLLTT